ncbi:hypothetical protein [Halostagnicola kamekurae]|uniref:Uncharacterized protein n=1 Tax=Halostagnicola kamekurae TaxID=619731 RepID=A0A1I6SHY7_9EURY|nr:hypothetical protein [Halostagnicola kamekurae]SFS76358.1 hypothetical protein SAMN04488556_2676 [Halostagnicola kamekurae]
MLERADFVLATIPLLAVSGLAVRTLLGLVGIGTGMLAIPLAPVGYLAAFGVIVRELLWVSRPDGPVGRA